MSKGWGRSRSTLFRALASLALLAAGVRALAPPGYMPTSLDDGRYLTVVLCTGGHGPRESVLDLVTGELVAPGAHAPDQDGAKGADDGPCTFGATAQLVAPDEIRVSAADVGRPLALAGAPAFLRPGAGLAAPPPWATGPPPSV